MISCMLGLASGSRFKTSPDKGSIQFVFNHGDLPITPFWIWQFPDAHLTEEDTKTVHINLNKIRDENERKTQHCTRVSYVE